MHADDEKRRRGKTEEMKRSREEGGGKERRKGRGEWKKEELHGDGMEKADCRADEAKRRNRMKRNHIIMR